jgi:predicted AlkP superfamily phosphohydrolase/phosphomutase
VSALLLATVLASPPGMFILGIDGMDPVILDRLLAEGRMPNFAKLAEEGSYQELGTSTPPQSPVAWSSFVTGMNPGGHGIFDFLHRDPSTYHPISSATRPVEGEPWVLRAFGYVLPLDAPEPENNRTGTPFWDILASKGVDVEVYRMPGNFPAPPSPARVLAGMGVVDMRGGFGTYTWYTSEPVERDNPKGDIQLVTVQDHDLDGIGDTATGVLRGPPDLFHLEPGQTPKEHEYLTERVVFVLDPEFDTVLIRIDGQEVLLRQGEWSGWVPVTYETLPGDLVAFDGIVRFYAKSLRPKLEIYASPVNISPANPSQPISSPEEFAVELYERLGHYYTKGLPEQTDALKDGTFTDEDYLQQVGLVQADTEAMLKLAIERFEPGDFTFMYVSDLDLQSHMLWRHHDPKYPDAPPHPACDHEVAPAHSHDLDEFYVNTDRLLKLTRDALPDGTVLVVMSDHGFQPYTRKVHLNAWLRDNGYLVLKEGKRTGQIVSGAVDWSKTRAYALGFNGLYINRKGREGQGIVEPSAVDALSAEISEKLLAWRDEDGTEIVVRMDETAEAYTGPRTLEAPDLIVGYNVRYGGSDENTLGEITELLIEDNKSRWSGNHLMSPDVVPGVVLSTKKIEGEGFWLADLTATVLAHFGIEKPANMVGRVMFQ